MIDQLVAILAALGICLLIAGWKYWLGQEAEKAEREKFKRIAQANSESVRK